MGKPLPVVTVTPTMASWFCDLDHVRDHRATIDATAEGVKVWIDPTRVPDEWLAAAKEAHETLKAGGDVSHLATHHDG